MTNGTDESSVHENCNAKDTLSASASLTTTNDNEKANGEEVVKVIAAAQDGDKDCQTAEETTIVDDHSSSSSQLQLKISESCSSSTIDGGIGGEPAKEGQPTVEVEVVEPTTTDNIMSTGVLLESASAIVSPLEEGENEDQSATPTQTSCEHGDSMNIDNDKHGSEIPGNNQDSSDNTAPPKEDENGMITSPVLSSKVDNNNANKPDNSHENQDGNTLQNSNNNNKSSSLFGDDLNEEIMAKVISEVETSSSVILSDAGETLTSTSPVINMTTSGMDSHDEKLLALGVFAKAANEDGDNTNIVKDFKKDAGSVVHESIDNNVDDVKPTIVAKSESEAKNSTSTRGDISPINTVPEKVVGENAIDAADIISSGLRKSTIPALSPSSFNSSGPSSGGYDKKRLNERLKLRLAKRNQMHSVTSSSPTKSVEGDVTAAVAAAPSMSSERDESRDRAQWETRLQAASRQKRQYKSRAKSEVSNNDGANSDILSRYSSSSDVVGGTRKIYPDTVTFSDGEDDDDDDDAGPTSLRIDTKIASRDRRTAYRKCVSEVGASMAMSTRSSRSKLSKHHPTHHHGIGILQSDGIVYDDEMLLRLARQARFGRGRGEVSTTNSDDDSGRVNEVKIHVYDLLTKDSLVEVPYFNCQFPIGQCFRIVNSGCHTLGTGAYHVGVEINGVEYAFGANNIIGMSGIFTCVPKESPGYEYRKCVYVVCLALHMIGLSQFINIILQEKLWILVRSTQLSERGYVSPNLQTLGPLP